MRIICVFLSVDYARELERKEIAVAIKRRVSRHAKPSSWRNDEISTIKNKIGAQPNPIKERERRKRERKKQFACLAMKSVTATRHQIILISLSES